VDNYFETFFEEEMQGASRQCGCRDAAIFEDSVNM